MPQAVEGVQRSAVNAKTSVVRVISGEFQGLQAHGRVAWMKFRGATMVDFQLIKLVVDRASQDSGS